jgi:purine-binding chemotaxis protein CheW
LEIVTFGLAGEITGIRINLVEEIIMDREPIQVPNLPDFLNGITKLRNQIIPIVEGTERLGYPMEKSPVSGKGQILIVNYHDELIGIRVETVYKIVSVKQDKIQSSPDSIQDIGADYVEAVAEVPNSFGSRKTTKSAQSGASPKTTTSRTSNDENEPEDSSVQTKNILLLNPDALFSMEEFSTLEDVRTEAHSGNFHDSETP